MKIDGDAESDITLCLLWSQLLVSGGRTNMSRRLAGSTSGVEAVALSNTGKASSGDVAVSDSHGSESDRLARPCYTCQLVTENDNCKTGMHKTRFGLWSIDFSMYHTRGPWSSTTYSKGLTPRLCPTGIKSVLIRVIQTISGHARLHALKRRTE
jgi:hypothetical protein